MGYLEALQQDGPECGYYLEVSFASGATVGWGNRAIAIAGLGLVQPRVLSISPIGYGIGQTWDAPLESPTLSVELDNADAELAPLLIGAATSASASAEYLGDSFLNARAVLFSWAIDAAGTVQTQQLSPTLVATRSPEAVDGRIRLSLQSRAADTLGRSKFGRVTLRMIVDSAAGAHGAGYGSISTQIRHGNADSSSWSEQGPWRQFSIAQADFSADLTFGQWSSDEADLDATVPFLFGRNYFPMPRYWIHFPRVASTAIDAGEIEEWHHTGNMPFGVLGVTTAEPSTANEGWRWSTTREAPEGRIGSEILRGIATIKRDIICDDGTTRAVWVVLASGDPRDFTSPPADGELGVTSGRAASPAAIIRQIATDLAGAGTGVSTTDFARAQVANGPLAGAVGGALRSDVELVGPIASLASVGSLACWQGPTGTLRCLAYPGWSADEVTAAAAALPTIRDPDVFAVRAERLPTTDGERGGGASRVRIRWTNQQLDKQPSRGRVDRSFGLPVGDRELDSETEIPGDWAFPLASQAVLDSAARHRFRTARRLLLTTRLWVGAAYEPPQLFRVSLSLARGGAGYSNRLMRLEHVEIDLDQHAATVRLEDLGPLEDLRPAVLDTYANWVRHDPAGTGISLALSSASTTVTASGGTPFASAVAGDSLQTFGSANAGNRVSKKITVVTSSTQVTVESVYATTEAALAASAAATPLVDTAWCVMKTQSTKTNTTKLTVCNEATGLFRDGATAGFVVTG